MKAVFKFISCFILFVYIFIDQSCLAENRPEYTVTRYTATFELVPDSDGELQDMAVTLDITYDITSGTKDNGFKYIGSLPVKNISVTDGNGEPLDFNVDKSEENKIMWYFPPVSGGEKTVVVSFILSKVLEGSRKKNHFSFEWVKNWKIPVYDITYRFILPEDQHFTTLTSSPFQGDILVHDDYQVMQLHMASMIDKPFRMKFAPGVVDATSFWGGDFMQVVYIFLSVPAFIGCFWLFLWLYSFLSKGGKSSKSGGGCGGGCSGGCGGGGCGGGCGG